MRPWHAIIFKYHRWLRSVQFSYKMLLFNKANVPCRSLWESRAQMRLTKYLCGSILPLRQTVRLHRRSTVAGIGAGPSCLCVKRSDFISAQRSLGATRFCMHGKRWRHKRAERNKQVKYFMCYIYIYIYIYIYTVFLCTYQQDSIWGGPKHSYCNHQHREAGRIIYEAELESARS